MKHTRRTCCLLLACACLSAVAAALRADTAFARLAGRGARRYRAAKSARRRRAARRQAAGRGGGHGLDPRRSRRLHGQIERLRRQKRRWRLRRHGRIERLSPITCRVTTSCYQFNPGRDEVLGIGDVLALDDGRAFYTLDDNFAKISIVALDAALQPQGDLIVRDGSMNSLAYDR